MKKTRIVMLVVPALLLLLASGTFAQNGEMNSRDNPPPTAPEMTIQTETPPPSMSDQDSERTNRETTQPLGEYKEKSQSVPTVATPESGNENGNKGR
jgi:hypothetical protein